MFDPTLQHQDFYTPGQVGRTQFTTPEGYLLCRDVPISRIGTLLYHESELQGLTGDERGIIHAERLEDEVFDPRSIASYAGKPVIVTHAGGTMTTENTLNHMVGVVMNPRRGQGDDSNTILADLMIYDPIAIQQIRDKIGHQVSAGYNAEYEQVAPGRARQYEIIGNHVALVENGRCGPRCAIGDEAMPAIRRRVQPQPAQRRRLVSTADAIRAAFVSRDEQALENALNSAGPDGLGDPIDEEMGTAEQAQPQTHNITVNINGGTGVADPMTDGPTVPAAAPTPGAVSGTPPVAATPAAAAVAAPPATEAMPTWAAPIMARLDAIEAKLNPSATAENEDDADPTKKGTADDMPEEFKKEKDKMTTDSASMQASFQQTMANAELLAPGVKLLTIDGAQTVKQTHDNLCSFRRQVLTRASADAAMGQKIAPLVQGKDFKTMTCDQVANTFDASATLVRALNGQQTMVGFMPRVKSTGVSKVMTPAEINAANRKLYNIE